MSIKSMAFIIASYNTIARLPLTLMFLWKSIAMTRYNTRLPFIFMLFTDISLKDNLGRNALHCVCASKSESPITASFKIIMERYAL